MAKEPWIASQDDRAIIQELVDERRVRRGNVPNRTTTEHTWSEGEDHQAPEVYIAKPQTSAGIPPLLPTDGTTGTGTDISGSLFDEPGKAECDIYQIVDNPTTGDPELHNIGLTEFVHNISLGNLPQDWIPVSRTKFGKWMATFAGSLQLEWAILNATLSESGTSTARIYRGGPAVANLVDSGEDVTVGAPPLMGEDTGTGTDVSTIPSGSWVLIAKLGAHWWVIGVAC